MFTTISVIVTCVSLSRRLVLGIILLPALVTALTLLTLTSLNAGR